MPGIQTILHPTDFSENSLPAFQTACALARDYNASVVVLHVMMPSESPFMERPPPNPLECAEAQEPGVHLPWPQAVGPPVRVEHRVAEGDAVEEIVRLAEAIPCDLVVMGTHGKTGLGRILTGSVAEGVLRRAGCPVLVVKAPTERSREGETKPIASPGDIIDARPLGAGLASAHSQTLVRTPSLEVVRLIVRAGQEIHVHKANGDLIVHCLEGSVTFTARGKTELLEAGKLLSLSAGELHSLNGLVAASLLLTIATPKS